MSQVSITVNGRAMTGEVEDRTLLVQYLRDQLGLTGTHVGCDTSQCGACVVHVEGRAVKSCTLLAVQAAFREHHGLQCGYCTPGMIMTAVDMIRRHDGALDEKTGREELEGNICRCTGYQNIVKAIQQGSAAMTS